MIGGGAKPQVVLMDRELLQVSRQKGYYYGHEIIGQELVQYQSEVITTGNNNTCITISPNNNCLPKKFLG